MNETTESDKDGKDKKKLQDSLLFFDTAALDNKEPKHIPFKDKLFLNPIEKYRIYGKFPVRMVLDLFLVILTTAQIIMVNGPTSAYTRAVDRFLHDIFLQNNDNPVSEYDVEYSKIKYLYTMEEIVNHVRKSKQRFFDLEDVSLGNLTIEKPEKETKIPVQIVYVNSGKSGYSDKTLYLEYNMTYNDSWIFNKTDFKEIKSQLILIDSFTLNYKVKTIAPYQFGDYYECFSWDINQKYSFSKRYHFAVSLKTYHSACEDLNIQGNLFFEGNFWVHILLIIFSFLNLVLTLRSIWTNYKYFFNFKYRLEKKIIEIPRENKPPKKVSKWEVLTQKDKNNLFSKYNIIQAVGCIIQLFGGVLSIYEEENSTLITKYFVGIGAMFSYLTLVRYLNFNWKFQTIFNTMYRSIPNLIMYFGGTLAIFILFILFSVANFPYSERFYSVTLVIMSLFAMMNGDSILDITRDLTQNSYFLGQIYIYSFNILFICVVINIFVSIIEEAFVDSKIKNKNHWMYSFAKKGDKNLITGGELRVYDEIRRKSILREALNKKHIEDEKKNEEEIQNNENLLSYTNSAISIQMVDDLSNNIDEATQEIKKISKEIIESTDSKMKLEIKEFLQNKIKNLKNLIKNIENSVK